VASLWSVELGMWVAEFGGWNAKCVFLLMLKLLAG
jgi:hypothetical protein